MDVFQMNPGSHVQQIIFCVLLIGSWYIASNFSIWLGKYRSLASSLVYGKAKEPTPKAQLYPGVTKESDFPEGWWTSKNLYTLERRAIFSKTWLFICHASLFQRPGDYRTFDIADFNIVVIFSKDGVIRAFHNVCRHRAYNVCTKSAGNALALRCRYHGWTYDSRGKLVKAPKFDDVVGFDKSQNGLFEVRTFIDTSGFVYVNLDAYGSDGLTIRVGMPIKARLNILETWCVEAKFNWKFGLRPGAFELHSLTNKRRLARLFNSASSLVEYWSWPAEFELSPLTRMIRTGYGDHWLTISVLPKDESMSRLNCTLFSSEAVRDSGSILGVLKREIQQCVGELEAAFLQVLVSGEVTNFETQEPLLAQVKAHSRLERLLKKEVHPVSRLQETSEACKVADDLCNELEAAAGDGSIRSPLDW